MRGIYFATKFSLERLINVYTFLIDELFRRENFIQNRNEIKLHALRAS